LVDDVIDLSRIEAGRVLVSPEPVSVAEVISEVRTTLEPSAECAGIAVAVGALPPELPDVVVDRTRLKQALMNFGSNAVKYGRKGGSVELTTSVEGQYVRITVRDDGIGIPKDKQSKVFQPFQRAGQETGPIEGTGIGLVITKRLAELMRGAVGFRSTEGQGSEFWIEIPAHRPEPGVKTRGVVPDRAATSALAASDGKRYLVVYVEDNPSNIAFMEDLIADYTRVELVVAPTAEIGVELVRARQPHLVIMDINLPGMSGFEAAKLLRVWPETQNIPIIALSAAAMLSDKARLSEVGFYRYLTKPIKIEELVAVLEEILLPT
jgi:CheY-like chemotaxis protein